MLLQIQEKSVFLGKRPTGFTENYYTEWDDGLGKNKVSLFMVLSIASSLVPGDEIGKEAFQLLQDHFLNDLTGDPYDRFEAALKEINIMIGEKEKELGMRFVPNVNVIAGVIERDMLFLSQRGEAQGYLIRKRHVSSITDGLFDEKNTEDLFQNIASGAMEVNDSVILATGKLIQYVRPGDLAKIFSEQSLHEAVKELENLVSSDIDEQISVFSFEVLEKIESVMKEESISKMEGKENSTLQKKRLKALAAMRIMKLEKPLGILRDWAERQDRLKVFKNMRTWGRDRILIAIIALIVILTGSISYLFIYGSKQKIIDEMELKLATAEENLKEAETKGSFDKETASTLLDNAETLAIEVLNSGYLRGKASQLIDDLDVQRDFLDNVIHVGAELVKLADLTTVLETESVLGLVPYRDRLAFYTDKNIYQVLIDSIQSPTSIDTDLSALYAAYFGDQENIVILSSGGKLIEYEEGNVQFADTADSEWKTGVALATYSSKIYILDSLSNQIWKYQRSRDAYGSAQAYVLDNSAVDLSNAISLAIDGNVWVLNTDGTIIKLLSGEVVSFEIFKAPLTPVVRATKIYTELDLNTIYVLDSGANTILVYSKSGKSDDLTYSSQYLLEDLSEPVLDIYFDREKDALNLVTSSALYQLKI